MLRTVRGRSRPIPRDGRDELVGTIQEVAEPPAGARPGPRHRRLAAFPGGLSAGRGPGAGRGPLHRRGAAGGGLAVHAGFLAGRSGGVRGRGRAADDHRAPRARRGRREPVRQHVAGNGLSGGRGGAHRPGLYLPTPEEYRRRYPPPGRSRSASAGSPGPFCRCRRRAHDGRVDGGLQVSGRLHARRAVRADDGRPDAGAGARTGRRRRVGARAVARTAALDDARARAPRSRGWSVPRGMCRRAADSRSAATGTT